MTPSYAFIDVALLYLGSAVVCVALFRKWGLGSILGYLAAGWLIGPWGTGAISNPESTLHFAELGVVLLLFVIGLELSPALLWRMRRIVFGLGILQVAATTGIIAGLLMLFGFAGLPSFIVGACLSLSSTAFAMQILGEKNLLNTTFGRSSFGILLFQDLAAIPLIAIVPLLASVGDKEPDWSKGALTFGIVVVLVVVGRFILPPIFRRIAKAKTREIFTAAALLLVLGIAMLMQKLGLSMALGSFLAGLLLSESEFRHELEADIEPFKGLLLGLFFISVGMSVNYGLLLDRPLEIFGATLALIVIKAFVIYWIGRMSGLKTLDSRSMATSLSQGGEFGFVVLTSAVAAHALESDLASILTVVITLSMAATPLLFEFNEKYLSRFLNRSKATFDTVYENGNPVIIAGFGRFGQIVGRILRVRKIGFTALEHDQEQVNVLRKFGSKVYFGDASRLELLEAAGARTAQYFVLAIDDVQTSIKAATLVRQHFPHLKIIARARNRAHAYELLALGVTSIHRETLPASLEATAELLRDLGFERNDVKDTIRKFREHDERVLLEQFTVRHDEKELINYSKKYAQQLSELFASDSPQINEDKPNEASQL
ncbi:MAG TPA: monovalent cation:proton antiporter-2 (CPA2) family protein [Bdellovibrionales bacterium]|nr:monovalent cation:proton antiporter-2 (CPA2) family protein [Bdellovibrionales bacterium]